MHRIALILTLLAVAAAGLAGPLVAAAQAPGPSTPQELAELFFARISADDEEVPACELLSRQLRDLFGSPTAINLDPRLPESYSEPNRLRACDDSVTLHRFFNDSEPDDRWIATRRGALTVVEERDGVVHLRAPVVRTFERERRGASRRGGQRYRLQSVADVFAVVEEGRWRLAWPGLLWEIAPREFGRAPTTIAELPAYLAAIERELEPERARERRLVADYLATRVEVAPAPLPFDGRASRVGDRPRDVVSWRGRPLRDQRRPTVDVRAAAARTAGGRLTLELRFRGPVPADVDVDVRIWQGVVRARESSWRTSLDGDWASAYRPRGTVALDGLRVSRGGNVLRLALPWQVAAGALRSGRPFRWELSASVETPAGVRTPAWVDDVPDQSIRQAPLHDPPGVLHRQ